MGWADIPQAGGFNKRLFRENRPAFFFLRPLAARPPEPNEFLGAQPLPQPHPWPAVPLDSEGLWPCKKKEFPPAAEVRNQKLPFAAKSRCSPPAPLAFYPHKKKKNTLLGPREPPYDKTPTEKAAAPGGPGPCCQGFMAPPARSRLQYLDLVGAPPRPSQALSKTVPVAWVFTPLENGSRLILPRTWVFCSPVEEGGAPPLYFPPFGPSKPGLPPTFPINAKPFWNFPIGFFLHANWAPVSVPPGGQTVAPYPYNHGPDATIRFPARRRAEFQQIPLPAYGADYSKPPPQLKTLFFRFPVLESPPSFFPHWALFFRWDFFPAPDECCPFPLQSTGTGPPLKLACAGRCAKAPFPPPPAPPPPIPKWVRPELRHTGKIKIIIFSPVTPHPVIPEPSSPSIPPQ